MRYDRNYFASRKKLKFTILLKLFKLYINKKNDTYFHTCYFLDFLKYFFKSIFYFYEIEI